MQCQVLISDARLSQARAVLDDRRRRNEAIDLADCLQFADKRSIIGKTEALRGMLGFASGGKADHTLGELENLRNDIAHAQDVIAGRWPGIVDLAQAAEEVLRRCESVAV